MSRDSKSSLMGQQANRHAKSRLAFAVSEDMVSHGLKGPLWRVVRTNHLMQFQVAMRRLEYWETVLGPIARLMVVAHRLRYRRLSERYGFTIPPGTFGPGLAIVHRGTIVVNKGAIVGRNCRIHQNVTIGSVRGLSPRIGNNVWIGAGAVVIGDIVIGDDVAIAANAVVTSDVPASVTVGGIPASIISQSSSSQWMRR